MNIDKSNLRVLTDEEIKRGIAWMLTSGFSGFGECRGGSFDMYVSREMDGMLIIVPRPHAFWQCRVYDRETGCELASSFGDYTDAEEAVCHTAGMAYDEKKRKELDGVCVKEGGVR